MRTHYDNLKVSETAPFEVIRAAYRALCQKMHPDKNPGDPDAHRIMQILNDAYAVLSDPAARAAYDDRLRATRQRTQSQGANPRRPTYPESAFPPRSAPPPARDKYPPPGYGPHPRPWRATRRPSYTPPARSPGLPYFVRPYTIIVIFVLFVLPWIVETCNAPRPSATIRRAIPVPYPTAVPWAEPPRVYQAPAYPSMKDPSPRPRIFPGPRGDMPEVAR